MGVMPVQPGLDSGLCPLAACTAAWLARPLIMVASQPLSSLSSEQNNPSRPSLSSHHHHSDHLVTIITVISLTDSDAMLATGPV